MVRVSRTFTFVVVGVATSVTLAACASTGGNKQADPGSGDALAKGGTVTVYHASDFEHLDPARSFVTDSQMAGRLLTRKLMDYKWDAKGKKVTLTHDLAEYVTHSDDFKTWTFKLRPGLKYEDGSAIKAADIKYNV